MFQAIGSLGKAIWELLTNVKHCPHCYAVLDRKQPVCKPCVYPVDAFIPLGLHYESARTPGQLIKSQTQRIYSLNCENQSLKHDVGFAKDRLAQVEKDATLKGQKEFDNCRNSYLNDLSIQANLVAELQSQLAQKSTALKSVEERVRTLNDTIQCHEVNTIELQRKFVERGKAVERHTNQILSLENQIREYEDDIRRAKKYDEETRTPLIESLRRDLTEARATIDRLKSGKFTPEELQQLCHSGDDSSEYQAFVDGCAQYQKKLFGKCDRQEQANEICELKADVQECKAIIQRWVSQARTNLTNGSALLAASEAAVK